MELVSPKIYDVFGLYINDYGKLSWFDEQFEFSITTDTDEVSIFKGCCRTLNGYLNHFNGLSYEYTATDDSLVTKDFNLKFHNPVLKVNRACMAYHGSMVQCLQENIKTDACLKLGQVGNSFSNAYSRYIQKPVDETTLPLMFMYADAQGIHIKRGKITFVFEDDRSATCPTCIEGLQSFKSSIVERINTSLIISDFNGLSITGDFINLDVNKSDDEITKELFNSFFPILQKARIRTVTYTSLQGNYKV